MEAEHAPGASRFFFLLGVVTTSVAVSKTYLIETARLLLLLFPLLLLLLPFLATRALVQPPATADAAPTDLAAATIDVRTVVITTTAVEAAETDGAMTETIAHPRNTIFSPKRNARRKPGRSTKVRVGSERMVTAKLCL